MAKCITRRPFTFRFETASEGSYGGRTDDLSLPYTAVVPQYSASVDVAFERSAWRTGPHSGTFLSTTFTQLPA